MVLDHESQHKYTDYVVTYCMHNSNTDCIKHKIVQCGYSMHHPEREKRGIVLLKQITPIKVKKGRSIDDALAVANAS